MPLMLYSFADSLRVPTFRRSWYFLRTDSLWYYEDVSVNRRILKTTPEPISSRGNKPVAKSPRAAFRPSNICYPSTPCYQPRNVARTVLAATIPVHTVYAIHLPSRTACWHPCLPLSSRSSLRQGVRPRNFPSRKRCCQ
jgi:hypothetical protein